MTQNLVKNIIGNVASSYQVNLAIENANMTEKIHKFAHFHLSTLGICNDYFCTSRCWEVFFDWPDIFLFGRARKLGMKLAIDYITRFSNRKSYAAYAF